MGGAGAEQESNAAAASDTRVEGVQTVWVSMETDQFHLLVSKNNLNCNLETKVVTHKKSDSWRGGGERVTCSAVGGSNVG